MNASTLGVDDGGGSLGERRGGHDDGEGNGQGGLSAPAGDDLNPRPAGPARAEIRALAALFLRLGLTAFGGPAAHIAMMHAETVRRRRWLSEQAFLDLLGATNLIPGPNSTEMAIHIGHRRAGWPGLVVAGVCFIAPAMLIVMALAWAYVRYGTTPQATWLLVGVQPVVIAIVAHAVWTLARSAIKNRLMAAVALGALGLYALGAGELGLLAAGGLLGLAGAGGRPSGRDRVAGDALPGLAPTALGIPPAAAAVAAATAFSLPQLFFTFLKIGAVLYGSGYVLLAFLRADFVARLGWLTDRQLLDAIAIGQVTPGPVFTTATFIGFILGGVPGAVVATVGIFLPAFVFVAVSNPLIPRIRASARMAGLLDGVNAASLALMTGVTARLGRPLLGDPVAVAVAVAALIALVRCGVNATWLVAAGAAIGWLRAGGP